jgi:cytoskeletal protein RodZ
MHNLNLGLTAPMRSIGALRASALRFHGTAALLVLFMAGAAAVTARQQATPPQPQPDQPQQQQPKPQTFDPYHYPGKPAPARHAPPAAADLSKKTTAPGKATTPAKSAPSRQRAQTKRTTPPPHSPKAPQSAAGKQTVAGHTAAAARVDSKKTAAPASHVAVHGKFGVGTGSYRSCLKGDNSPDGTVKEGFRKVVTPTAVGPSCHWEKVE